MGVSWPTVWSVIVALIIWTLAIWVLVVFRGRTA